MTRLIDSTRLLGKAIHRGESPKPAASMTINIDFSIDPTWVLSLDLSKHTNNKYGISGVQSVFVDNSNNSQIMTATFDNGYFFKVPPYAQGIWPVLYSGDLLNVSFSLPAAGSASSVVLLNTREQSQLWTTKIPISGTVNVTGSTVYTQPWTGSFTDASRAQAVGGASEQIIAANGTRQLLAIRNPSSAAAQNIAAPESAFINFTGAAAVNGLSSWELLPGEQLPQFLMQSVEAVFMACATTGHRLVCKWM